MSGSTPIPKLVRFDKAGQRSRHDEKAEPADLRWSRVEEFLRSRELSANPIFRKQRTRIDGTG
ncbi:MAG: hypothetical protein BRC40_17340 [Cyanobacteria bacterium QH_8_48_120]|nr:MAG: hypothetical protein BRC40_17340 [Cyanobacteria bacterium QH_8_48_120]PSO96902.1 MAG: hypothetical protein BRC48_05640 [Cyanobacteria bacterium QS_9_48_30]PSP01931.1 MAG: hypothetical protein BRC47_08565 [Cyanobacteria bacterium QS_7_48_42]PSP10009.1 MAG: hypothetical protein BRC50_15930 [Cyanobacteria bacterium SW_11_48_12]